jgi:predicted dehydrogenase
MTMSESTSTSTVRVGLIGTGDIAREHRSGYVLAGAEVVALCDANPEQLAKRQHEWDVHAGYTDYSDLLADPTIQAVSICTPNSSHHPITIAAAAAGKHVLCEKPVSLDLGQAQEMIDACAAARVVYQVGHHMRSWAAAAKAKELIDSGAIGAIAHIRLRQTHDWGGGAPRGVFASKAHSGGGTLLDNGCHLFDLARYFGGDVVDVYARVATRKFDIEVEDTGIAMLGFVSGAVGSIETGWTSMGFDEGFLITGTEGSLSCDNHTGANILVQHYRLPGAPQGVAHSVVRHELHAPKSHAQHVANFLASISSERPVICTGQDGLESVRLALCAYESAATGRPISL